MKVLVVATQEMDDRKTLCAVRSLGRAGFDVTIASDAFEGRSFHSRYGRSRVLIPRPEGDAGSFIEALREQIEREGYDVLLPTTDLTTIMLSRHAESLDDLAALPVPPRAASALCKDKMQLADFAVENGIEVPKTHCVLSEDLLRELSETRDYPMIFKPRKGSGGVGTRLVQDMGELLDAYRQLPGAGEDVFDFTRPLVQEFVPGSVHEVNALFNRGEPRALLTQRRILKYPRFGAGIYNETTNEPDLKEHAVMLLSALNWHGPAQVEFLRHEKTGKPFLLEVNGRFWGTMDLSVAAGMDFPVLACRMARDGDIPEQMEYRVGLRYRWPFPYAILHVRETGRWLGAVRDFLLPHRATRSDLSLSDPVPLIMEFAYTARRVWRRRGKAVDPVEEWRNVRRKDGFEE